MLPFEEIQEDYRTPEFSKKYEGKGEKVELKQGGRKSVVLKLVTEEGEKRLEESAAQRTAPKRSGTGAPYDFSSIE